MPSMSSDEYARLLRIPPPRGTPYSVAIENSELPGRSKVYRHWRFVDRILETLDPAVTTGHELFEVATHSKTNQRCLGYRPYNKKEQKYEGYQWLSYADVQERRRKFGIGLVDVHFRSGISASGYGVGLWSQNRVEWQIADLGCMSQSLFTVSLYETLGPDTTQYVRSPSIYQFQ